MGSAPGQFGVVEHDHLATKMRKKHITIDFKAPKILRASEFTYVLCAPFCG